MKTVYRATQAIMALGLIALGTSAQAAPIPAGSVLVGVGVHNVAPKSDNGTIANNTLAIEVGSNARPTVTGEYFLYPNVGIEAIAALPFKHEISVKNVGKVGETQHLPPTVSLQYYFKDTVSPTVTPFVGAGLNYTTFFSEKTTGALDGTSLKLKDSFGLALHAGVDFEIAPNRAIRLDLRAIDIDTEVSVNGTKMGTVNIDPMVYGAAYMMRF